MFFLEHSVYTFTTETCQVPEWRNYILHKVPCFRIAHARYEQTDRRTDGKAISISEHLACNARYKHSVKEI